MKSRRRSTPWIHRWSRVIIGVLAIVGALLTGYLTAIKVTSGAAACPTQGCEQVLSSPYATVFGQPLSLFGFLAYASMAVFALVPLAVSSERNKELRTNLESWTWLLLLAGSTAMTVFSGYLMYLLSFEIRALCIYCLASALFCLSLLILTIVGREWDDVGQILFTAIVVGMVTLISTLGVYANVNRPAVEPGQIPPVSGSPRPEIGGWRITTASGEAEIALAQHLNEAGATMYAAYWCPHCHDQKQLFGQEAISELNYIECDPKGRNAQPEVCTKAGVQGFPSWQINGEVRAGVQPLEQLAQSTGYQGPTNFRYSLPGR